MAANTRCGVCDLYGFNRHSWRPVYHASIGGFDMRGDRKDRKARKDRSVRIVILLLTMAALVYLLVGCASAHDADPEVSRWMSALKQPDNPAVPCCGEADAYWADEVHVRQGKTFATITDDRADELLGRHHVPMGTEIEIPSQKLKHDAGNPTGHAVVFLNINNVVLCYVQGNGI